MRRISFGPEQKTTSDPSCRQLEGVGKRLRSFSSCSPSTDESSTSLGCKLTLRQVL